jgi:rubrerythrin
VPANFKPALFSALTIDWNPFRTCAEGEKAPYPRSLSTPEGLGDRLRFVAFAEKQATHAFSSAAEIFSDQPAEVKKVWRTLATEEQKHLNWLLTRMQELEVDPSERPVSLALWRSFDHCGTARHFAEFMASAEERGRIAGEQFYQTLLEIDPITAQIFNQIAIEEQEHILLAQSIFNYLPELPNPPSPRSV